MQEGLWYRGIFGAGGNHTPAPFCFIVLQLNKIRTFSKNPDTNELKISQGIDQTSIKNLNGTFTIELLINSNSLLPMTNP